MIVQLDPPIPVDTPKGPGFCVAWIDYSQEHDTLWKVCITATGEFWDVPQSQVRGVKNVSMGRTSMSLSDAQWADLDNESEERQRAAFEAGLKEAWRRVDEWVVDGPLSDPQRSERNGLILACNLILHPQRKLKDSEIPTAG